MGKLTVNGNDLKLVPTLHPKLCLPASKPILSIYMSCLQMTKSDFHI